MKLIINLLVFILLAPGPVFAANDPLAVVRETADKVLSEVIANKQALDENPSGLNELISSYIEPHFNFARMTQSAMGRYWQRASETQKASLIEEFRTMLVKTYGVALRNYSGQKIIYLPVRPSSESNYMTIETKVAEANGGLEVPVDYRMVQEADDWKVYDVVIDGVSLVSNYRTSFSGQIRRGGIDGLIQEMKKQNQG